jgi:hypothetical protein
MYAMVCIRQDISHAISIVSPCKVYWQAMKLILHYLRGTTNNCLVFNRDSDIDFSVIGYVNSDYTDDLVVTHNLNNSGSANDLVVD